LNRNIVLADSGPLYASTDPDDQYHHRAQEEGVRLSRSGTSVVIAYPTMLETYSLVMRRMGPRVAQELLNELADGSGFLTPSSDDFARACALPHRYRDQRLSLFDSLVAVLSERLVAPIWTYDADFDVIGANVWR
jgi:predicted nucleic acid-binding protein